MVLFSQVTFAQELADNPAQCLTEYIKLREGYKRSDTKQFSRTEQFEMDDICYAMDKKFPNAWETQFMWYLNGHFIGDRGDRIKSAYNGAPDDKRVIQALFGYYLMTNNLEKQKELLPKVKTQFTTLVLEYYEEVMPPSGVIIVSSEQEAIPLRILQLGGKGKTVTIVTMDHLINNDFKQRVSSKLGTGADKFFGSEADFIAKAMKQSNVYLSSTVSQNYLSKIGSTVYLTGLYYEGNVTDQKNSLEHFWLRAAGKNFASMKFGSKEKALYVNYLPPLLTLYKMKLAAGTKDAALKKAISVLAEKVEQTKTVNDILTDYDNG